MKGGIFLCPRNKRDEGGMGVNWRNQLKEKMQYEQPTFAL